MYQINLQTRMLPLSLEKQKGSFATVNISPSKTFQTYILPSHSTTTLDLVSRMSITNTIWASEDTFISASFTDIKYATSIYKSVATCFDTATIHQINVKNTRYQKAEFVTKTIDIATNSFLTERLISTVPSVSKYNSI